MNTLESIQEDILDLREMILEIDERIWNSVDHQNPEALSAFINKKHAINEKLRTFRAATDELLDALAAVEPLETAGESEPAIEPDTRDDETIAPIDRPFRFTKPKAIIFEGDRIEPLTTWQAVWKKFLDEFWKRYPELFLSKLNETHSITGISDFPDQLRRPYGCGGIFFECNLSADDIANKIRNILLHSKISTSEIKIVLRGNPDLKGTLFELRAE